MNEQWSNLDMKFIEFIGEKLDEGKKVKLEGNCVNDDNVYDIVVISDGARKHMKASGRVIEKAVFALNNKLDLYYELQNKGVSNFVKENLNK